MMPTNRPPDRLIAHLRAQVAELRRLEREGAAEEHVAERRRVIMRLQDHLAHAVQDLLGPPHPSSA